MLFNHRTHICLFGPCSSAYDPNFEIPIIADADPDIKKIYTELCVGDYLASNDRPIPIVSCKSDGGWLAIPSTPSPTRSTPVFDGTNVSVP